MTCCDYSSKTITRSNTNWTIEIVIKALANFDPIWNGALIARNAGLLVWDTLYGVDNTLTPRRQMVEAEEVSADGLTWTFRLRHKHNRCQFRFACWTRGTSWIDEHS